MTKRTNFRKTLIHPNPGLADATILVLPFSAEQSEIINSSALVTVSYGSGASKVQMRF